MKGHTRGYLVAGLMALACALLLGAIAYAEIPAATPSATNADELSGVSHRWVERASGYMPYTEPASDEQNAKQAAADVLANPSECLIRNADHGYDLATRQVALSRLLKGSTAVLVGHEVIVWNEDRAARLYVNTDGLVRVIQAGALHDVLPTPSTAAKSRGEKDAAEIAIAASELATALNPGDSPAAFSLVSAHMVGFADKTGAHQLFRVDVHGNVSRVEW